MTQRDRREFEQAARAAYRELFEAAELPLNLLPVHQLGDPNAALAHMIHGGSYLVVPAPQVAEPRDGAGYDGNHDEESQTSESND